MALFNYASKELTLKVVYYGPGLSGKTTNLQHLHSNFPPEKKGKLLSLSTESDRTLFFDFLPLELGRIKDFRVRFQLYTVPGQIRYNATRKLVLKGADAVVFVADSQADTSDFNIESLENMRENLLANNIDPEEIQIIFQYNKRDLKNILSVDQMNARLNPAGYPVFEAQAINGKGVDETFQAVTKILLKDLANRYNVQMEKAKQEEPYLQKRPLTTAHRSVGFSPKTRNMEMPEKEKAETSRILEAFSDGNEILKKDSNKKEPAPPGLQTGTFNDLLEQSQQLEEGPKIDLPESANKIPEILYNPPRNMKSMEPARTKEPGAEEKTQALAKGAAEADKPGRENETAAQVLLLAAEIDGIKDSVASLKTEMKTALAGISSVLKTPKKESEVNAADIIKLTQTIAKLSEEVEPLKGLDVQKIFPEGLVLEILNSLREIKKEQTQVLTIIKGLTRDLASGKKKSKFLGLI